MERFLYISLFLVYLGLANADMVAYWSMDENSGSVANDSQNNLDGTINGADWTPGKYGSALNFYYDSVDVGNRSKLQNFSQLTIATWIYWTGATKAPTNYDFLVGKEGVYKIDIDQNRIRFLTNNDWTGSILTTNAQLSNNSWYHIAAVYDGTEKRIYINGVEDLNTVATSGDIGSSIYSFTMGAQPNSAGSYEDCFRGKLDDVRIYNQALTQQEIQSIMIPEPATVLLTAFGCLLLRKKNQDSI